ARRLTSFVATPVSADRAVESTLAPELAKEEVSAVARAVPVAPEAPLLPVVADGTGLPTGAEPVSTTLALPVSPVVPEFPEVATGEEVAVEDAAPVLPVLVALAWETPSPVSPEETL